MFVRIVHLAFNGYILLLFVRIVGSWFSSLQGQPLMQLVAKATDPYLNFFRRFIPPLGGLDLSPMLAFFALQFFQKLVISFFR